MSAKIIIEHATSSGEDLDIDRFFVGRDIELKRALEAVRQKRMIIVDGYTSARKSYFALQCLNVLGRDTSGHHLREITMFNKAYSLTSMRPPARVMPAQTSSYKFFSAQRTSMV